MATRPRDGGLTRAETAAFRRDGYLVIADALPASTVSALLAETQRLLASFAPADHPLTRFSTGGPDGRAEHVGNEYFLGSGDQVRFFLEEAAVDVSSSSAVNKIGHGLHMRCAPFARLLVPDDDDDDDDDDEEYTRVRPAAVARALGFSDPRCLQSMVICKPPEIGGAVPPHQDSTFLYTSPPSAVGFWYALEDATLDNGCLSFAPGSHRRTPVARRLVRLECGDVSSKTVMVGHDGPRFPRADEDGDYVEDQRDDEEYVPAEVKAGSLVLIHGNLLHKSEENRSAKGRIIYTFHMVEWEGTTYDERNWLQPPPEGFTKLYA